MEKRGAVTLSNYEETLARSVADLDRQLDVLVCVFVMDPLRLSQVGMDSKAEPSLFQILSPRPNLLTSKIEKA